MLLSVRSPGGCVIACPEEERDLSRVSFAITPSLPGCLRASNLFGKWRFVLQLVFMNSAHTHTDSLGSSSGVLIQRNRILVKPMRKKPEERRVKLELLLSTLSPNPFTAPQDFPLWNCLMRRAKPETFMKPSLTQLEGKGNHQVSIFQIDK